MAENSGPIVDRNALDEGWGDLFGADTVPSKPAAPAGVAPVVPLHPKPAADNTLLPAPPTVKPASAPTALLPPVAPAPAATPPVAAPQVPAPEIPAPQIPAPAIAVEPPAADPEPGVPVAVPGPAGEPSAEVSPPEEEAQAQEASTEDAGVPVEVPAPADAPGPVSELEESSVVGRAPKPSEVTTLPGSVKSPIAAEPTTPAPAANEPSRMPMVAVAVAAVAGVGLFLSMSGGEAPPPADAPAVAAAVEPPEAPTPVEAPAPPEAPPVVEAAALPEPPPVEEPLEAVEAPPADEAAELAAVEDAPEPEPEPEPAPELAPAEVPTQVPAGLGDAAAALASGQLTRAYDLAAAADKSPESLRIMVLASCQQALGGQARGAYRALRGGALRTEVRNACKPRGVDLTLAAREDTAAEVLEQGELALATGDAARAHDLARKSQRLERSTAAVLLMGRAGCKLGDAEKAKFAYLMLRPNLKETLAGECGGIDLGGAAEG